MHWLYMQTGLPQPLPPHTQGHTQLVCPDTQALTTEDATGRDRQDHLATGKGEDAHTASTQLGRLKLGETAIHWLGCRHVSTVPMCIIITLVTCMLYSLMYLAFIQCFALICVYVLSLWLTHPLHVTTAPLCFSDPDVHQRPH